MLTLIDNTLIIGVFMMPSIVWTTILVQANRKERRHGR